MCSWLGHPPGREPHSAAARYGARSDLVIGHSVFTHITESAVLHYLTECGRLPPRGSFRSTWFLCEKAYFPMMQDFQNALYTNEFDPANAVIYDRQWLVRTIQSVGLVIVNAKPPSVRGFHGQLLMRPSSGGSPSVDLGLTSRPSGRWLRPSRQAITRGSVSNRDSRKVHSLQMRWAAYQSAVNEVVEEALPVGRAAHGVPEPSTKG